MFYGALATVASEFYVSLSLEIKDGRREEGKENNKMEIMKKDFLSMRAHSQAIRT